MKNNNSEINEELVKKIKELEFMNSSLIQTNELLTKKLNNLTEKYNSLKNDLYDMDLHIIFCKKNLIELVQYNKEENQQKIDNNFILFKKKIKMLFEYDDDFMKTDSDITVYNMIIDNIKQIKHENLLLNKNLQELKNFNKKKYYFTQVNEAPSPISVKNYNNYEQENNSYTTEEILKNKIDYNNNINNNKYNYNANTPLMDEYCFYGKDEQNSSSFNNHYKNSHRLYHKKI